MSGPWRDAISTGRTLGPADAGTNHVIVSPVFRSALGVHPGSTLSYTISGKARNSRSWAS